MNRGLAFIQPNVIFIWAWLLMLSIGAINAIFDKAFPVKLNLILFGRTQSQILQFHVGFLSTNISMDFRKHLRFQDS